VWRVLLERRLDWRTQVMSDVSMEERSQRGRAHLSLEVAHSQVGTSIPRIDSPSPLPNFGEFKSHTTFITWRGGKPTRPPLATRPPSCNSPSPCVIHPSIGSSPNSLYKQASSSIVWLMGVWSWLDVYCCNTFMLLE
jgi:hypothetical protein